MFSATVDTEFRKWQNLLMFGMFFSCFQKHNFKIYMSSFNASFNYCVFTKSVHGCTPEDYDESQENFNVPSFFNLQLLCPVIGDSVNYCFGSVCPRNL